MGPLADSVVISIQAKDGNFYGTTRFSVPLGGGFGSGTVFKVTPGGVVTTLHVFNCGLFESCNASALVETSDGSFWGTTTGSAFGGPFLGGTVFKLTPGGVLTTLHSFDCGTEGCGPQAPLVQASDGNVYGTTFSRGAFGGGTVFKMTPAGALTTLHSLGGCNTDGCSPSAALIRAKDGNFYGTTVSGGAFGGGTVFRVTPGRVVTTVHAFDCSVEGCSPHAPLIQAKDGNFYGTTSVGGTSGGGTVFKLTSEGVLTTLHAFDCFTEGCGPIAALLQASDDNFYGTTPGSLFGNPFYGGTVFKLTPDGVLTTLHAFAFTDGSAPSAALIQAQDGNLYGTTAGAFGGLSTAFKLTLGGVVTPLHAFDCSTEGCGPSAPLIEAQDGNFYGTTVRGALGGGSVFKLTPGGDVTTLHAFDCSTEGCPSYAGLVQAIDGSFYGTTFFGGAFGGGTVFKLTPDGAFTTLHGFNCSTEGCGPYTLIQTSDGGFHGTLGGGGPQNGGVVFQLVPPNRLTALGPAKVWIGLKNSDDVGVRFDLRAEVHQNDALIGSGHLASAPGGGSGFNNAKLHAVPLALSAPEPVSFGPADIVSITLYVRNACIGSGKSAGAARLWFNDAAANSLFSATIAGQTRDRDYVLRSGFALSTTVGASKQSVDAAVGARCGSFAPFGTWRIVLP